MAERTCTVPLKRLTELLQTEQARDKLAEALRAIAYPKIEHPMDELGMDFNAAQEIAIAALDALAPTQAGRTEEDE